MNFTLGEAARHCGVAKGTISKAIKTGKLSATRREDGSWSIDNAELARYLEANGHRFRSETVETDRPETGDETDAAMSALVAELNRVIVDLRADRDAWREQAQRLALPAPKPSDNPPATAWRRFLRWRRAIGCLASAGVLLALVTGPAGAQEQPQQGHCFTVVMTRSTTAGSLGAILVDQCTGKRWQLIRTSLPGGAVALRWFPITVETAEARGHGTQ